MTDTTDAAAHASAIDQLRHCTLSHVWGSLGGRVALHCLLDPDLYDATTVLVTAQTRPGAIDAALRAIDRCRNGTPRLVAITVIAGLEVGR